MLLENFLEQHFPIPRIRFNFRNDRRLAVVRDYALRRVRSQREGSRINTTSRLVKFKFRKLRAVRRKSVDRKYVLTYEL